MNKFYKNPQVIKIWIELYKIKNYHLRQNKEFDFLVDVEENVSLNNKNLTSIPVKFGIIRGSFSCKNNRLTSLDFAP